jgi:restriction system protein
MTNRELIDHKSLSLEKWLELVLIPSDKRNFEILDCQFATDEHLQLYISDIQERSDVEIKKLLTLFLIPNGHLGHDDFIRTWLYNMPNDEFDKALSTHSFLERVVIPNDKNPPWHGITWVIDLLPHHPQQAIEAIQFYFRAHCSFLPDGRIHGLSDAQSLIRAKYIEHHLPVKQTLLDMTSRDFELLVAYLYKKKGYEVTVTKRTRDGGYDVLAEKFSDREQERLHIECKRHEINIGVPIARQVLGTLNIANATKAVVVASTEFTKSAISEAHQSKRLELVNVKHFDAEMRRYVHVNWIYRIPEYLMQIKKDLENNTPTDFGLKATKAYGKHPS